MASAQIFSIGSEILLGETVDTNAAHLGAELARLGVELRGIRALPDDRRVIAAAFVDARREVDLVVATGGLGPTHDDLTREGLADALGEPLAEDAGLVAALRARWRGLGDFPTSNLRQASRIPSAEILANPIGSASGWWVDRDGVVCVLMPGVPSEMRRMWADEVVPRLRERLTLTPLHVRSVKTWGLGESRVADLLAAEQERPGAGIEAGIYARDDGVHLRFSSREAEAPLDALVERCLAALGEDAWGTDDDELGAVALAALARVGATTVASWEADTGGVLLAILAAARSVNGSADYVGGMLDVGGPGAVPLADAVIQLSLLDAGRHGRSRVRVAVSGTFSMPPVAVSIHGSGPQRQRRAAYAALDVVRRAVGH
jgi:nicotinamide-nucleotide amidase